jgi:hypothetical protein
MGQSKSMNFECITAAQKQQQQESQVHPHAGKISLETDFSVREKSLATQISAAKASTNRMKQNGSQLNQDVRSWLAANRTWHLGRATRSLVAQTSAQSRKRRREMPSAGTGAQARGAEKSNAKAPEADRIPEPEDVDWGTNRPAQGVTELKLNAALPRVKTRRFKLRTLENGTGENESGV